MKKKNQVDNAEEFLKLFPGKACLHTKDVNLRKEHRELVASRFFQTLSPSLQIEMNRSLASVKGTKSKLVEGITGIRIYEKAVIRFEDSLIKAKHCIREDPLNENVDFEEIQNLQKSLLKLPMQTLVIFLKDIIASAGIEIVLKETEEKLNADKLYNLHLDLKKKYRANLTNYSLEQREQIGKMVQYLASIKSDLKHGRRTLKTYNQKIGELQYLLI